MWQKGSRGCGGSGGGKVHRDLLLHLLHRLHHLLELLLGRRRLLGSRSFQTVHPFVDGRVAQPLLCLHLPPQRGDGVAGGLLSALRTDDGHRGGCP